MPQLKHSTTTNKFMFRPLLKFISVGLFFVGLVSTSLAIVISNNSRPSLLLCSAARILNIICKYLMCICFVFLFFFCERSRINFWPVICFVWSSVAQLNVLPLARSPAQIQKWKHLRSNNCVCIAIFFRLYRMMKWNNGVCLCAKDTFRF